MPSGVPITPSGIWSSENAIVYADTAPAPSPDASAVMTTKVICVTPSPITRGPIRAKASFACASLRSIFAV
jgi:hypothetical protein